MEPDPPEGFASWFEFALATVEARSPGFIGSDFTIEQFREFLADEVADFQLGCASSSRAILKRWAPKLAEKLGRPAAEIAEDGLKDSDFGTDIVRIRFGDGSSVDFHQAFLLGDPKADGAIHVVAVFTSQHGYYEFWMGPNDSVEIQPQADHVTSWTGEFEIDPVTGDLVLPFSEEFLRQEDWRLNDRLRFEDVQLGSMKIVNVSKQERDKLAGESD